MVGAITAVTCACSGTVCSWISHATSGRACDNTYTGHERPPGWDTIEAVGLCCTSCIAIRQMRDAGPITPLRWSKDRTSVFDLSD